jgi:endo-1,4-beta-xylanase
MNRRKFLGTSAAAAAAFYWAPSLGGQNDQSEHHNQSDADILKECGPRIERHRKGDGAVVVRNARGLPLPGVKVRLEQLRHDFLFGCNLFNFNRCGGPKREEKYRNRFAALFNYCTLPFYWAQYEPERGRPDYAYTQEAIKWTRANGITCKGHPLVWDNPASSPKWLARNAARIKELSDERVRDLVSRFKGEIDIWYVVNEATHLPEKANQTTMAEFGLKIGEVPYVRQPLKIAREANPSALLLVNDYRTDSAYYQLLKKLEVNGRYLFDVIGIQSHMHDGVWPLHEAWDIADPYSKLGLPIHFTETTIVSGTKKGKEWGETTSEGEAGQATNAVNFYHVLFAHPSVQAISWWDFSDYQAWQGAPAGLVRKDMSPKPVYQQLISLVKNQWWTRLAGETGPRGNFTTRGFFGTYNITVEPPGGRPISRQVHWQRGQANEFLFQI